MRPFFLMTLLILLAVACTPADDESVLPTRVVLPTDTVAEATPPVDIDALEVTPPVDIDALEVTPPVDIDALEVTPPVDIDALEVTPPVDIDALEVTPPVDIDALEVTPPVDIDALEVTPPIDIDALEVTPPIDVDALPIVIPPLNETPSAPPVPTGNGSGLVVVMPTLDLTNLPTSVPTPTPYPLVENFATLTESTQVVRLSGTVEIFIEPISDDAIYLLRDMANNPVQILWDYDVIDYFPSRNQVIEVIGIVSISARNHAPLEIIARIIIPITQPEERDI